VIKLRELIVILDLHKEGLSVSAIAERTGLDRKIGTNGSFYEGVCQAPLNPDVQWFCGWSPSSLCGCSDGVIHNELQVLLYRLSQGAAEIQGWGIYL